MTYRTHQELKEKVDYYLTRPEERTEIAGRAYARALPSANIPKLLQSILAG